MKKALVLKKVRETYKHAAKSGCCCGKDPVGGVDIEKRVKSVGYSLDELGEIPQEAVLGLGCGNPVAIAGLKEGEVVLDLGSGAGIDVFLASKRVGKKGLVIGVDMTPEMLDKSRELAHKHKFGNVEFRLGEIEHLPIADKSVDVVISNCVINLSPDKPQVFSEIFRVLKPKGRLAVSDIVLEGELTDSVKKSLTAWSACVSGALPEKEYLKLIKEAGFSDVLVDSRSSFDCGIKGVGERIASVKVQARKA
jgi:SAM-dependent methyltransferase